MHESWVPTRLSPAQREERRRAAAALFPKVRRGTLSQAAVARQVGVSREAVRQWYATWACAGVRGLRRRPKTGRPPKLRTAEWRRLTTLLQRGAVACGYDTEQWTLRRVADLIRREFGVSYHARYLERPLRALGFRPQRPAVQAKERDEALVRAWVKHDWEAIKKRLGARGASLPSWMRRVTRFGAA
jgi:transposase